MNGLSMGNEIKAGVLTTELSMEVLVLGGEDSLEGMDDVGLGTSSI
jgi:hypothetical protein